MIRTLLMLICFCIIQIGYSQIQSGKVIYKIVPPDVTKVIDTAGVEIPTANKIQLLGYVGNLIKTLPYVELELTFTPHESILDIGTFLANDNKLNLKGGLGATNTHGAYYSNIKENIYIHQHSDLRILYLIESNFDALEWEIHDETKIIQGYTCIKATTNIIGSARDFPTTVWFAPDLPFPFGPKEFRGLPGLILAIDYNHYYFYADSIDLDTKSRSIKRPKKGETISNAEYLEKARELYKSMRFQK